jgi:restriction system protein
MPVPDYQSLMAPVLGALADGGDRSLAELRTVLAERLGLTEEDLQAKIPSGTPLFANRLHWAVTYMHQAGLLSRPKRGGGPYYRARAEGGRRASGTGRCGGAV